MPKTKQKHIISTSEKQDAELQIKEMQKQIDYDTKDFTIELLIEKFKKEDFFTNESLNKLKREFNNEFSDVEFNDIFNKFLNSLKYPKIKDRLSKSYYEKLWKADTLEILKEEPFIYRENEIIYKGFIDRVVVGYKNNKISNIEIIDFKTDVVKPQDLNFKANFYEPQINIYKNALIKRYGNNVNIHATLLFILMGEDYNYGNN